MFTWEYCAWGGTVWSINVDFQLSGLYVSSLIPSLIRWHFVPVNFWLDDLLPFVVFFEDKVIQGICPSSRCSDVNTKQVFLLWSTGDSEWMPFKSRKNAIYLVSEYWFSLANWRNVYKYIISCIKRKSSIQHQFCNFGLQLTFYLKVGFKIKLSEEDTFNATHSWATELL